MPAAFGRKPKQHFMSSLRMESLVWRGRREGRALASGNQLYRGTFISIVALGSGRPMSMQ
ncbi:hypothetical protein FRX31_026433, partial [Thalictrum thalictroides]